MAGSCLLYNELHYNSLMTDLGLSPSSSSPYHVPLVSVPMLSPFALQPTSHPCLRLFPSDLRFKNVRDIPENLRRFSEKVQRFSEKVQRFSGKLQHFQDYLRCLEEKLQLPSPHLPLFPTFHLAPNRSLLSASSCFCWHFSLPKGLTLPPPLFH